MISLLHYGANLCVDTADFIVNLQLHHALTLNVDDNWMFPRGGGDLLVSYLVSTRKILC